MAWLYVPALKELSSDSDSLNPNIEPSVMSRGNYIQRQSLERAWKKNSWMKLLSGMTLEPLMADRGVEKWISSLLDSPASHGVMQGSKKEPKMSDGYGQTLPESLARFDQDSCSWRTYQVSLVVEEPPLSLETLPKSGIILHGKLYPLPTSEQTTNGKGSGYLVGTPTADTHSPRSEKFIKGRTPTPVELAKMWPTPTQDGNYNRKGASPTSGDGLATVVKRYPTPSVMDSAGFCGKPDKNRKGPNSGRTLTGKALEMEGMGPHAEKWPTPTSRANPDCQSERKRHTPALESAVKMFPTVTVQDAKNNAGPSQSERNTPPLNAIAGGQLNPTWVEWLMGFPIGWTGLEPVETESFRLWLQLHIRSLCQG